MIVTHCMDESGTVSKTAPPYWTIAIWTAMMKPMTTKNVGLPRKNGGIFPSRARQLIPFQTAAMMKPAKKTVPTSSGVAPPRNPVASWRIPARIKNDPVTMMESHMNGVTICASCGTGLWFISPWCGASEQSAKAASVSMMMLIQRIWMIVKGSG